MSRAQHSGIEIDDDILGIQNDYMKFDPQSYQAILCVAAGILLGGFLLQWLCILRSFKVRSFDFGRGAKSRVSNPLGMLALIIKAQLHLLCAAESRLEFIKAYGIEIYSFLNLQVKMLAVMVLQCAATVGGLWLFNRAGDGSVPLGRFLVGDCPFEQAAELYTLQAVVFALVTYLALHALHSDSSKVHLSMFLSNKEVSRKHRLVPHVAYLSNINRGVGKAELERDIAEVLGIFPGDFILLLFPTAANICGLETALQQAQDLYNYQVQGGGLFTRWLYSTQSLAYHFHKAEGFYRERIAAEIRAPLRFNGRGVIFFYKIGDVENFYRLNSEYKIQTRLLQKNQQAFREALLTPSIRTIGGLYKTFLFRYNDVLTKNLDLHAPIYVAMRLVLYGALSVLLLFVSTPNTIIQGLIDAFVPADRDATRVDELLAAPDTRVVLNLAFPLVTYVFNLGIILSIEQLGKWQKFSRHSLYQSYIIRVSFVYLLVNMFFVPGFSLGTSRSLWEMFRSESFSPLALLAKVRLQENRNFLPTLVLQTGVFSFLGFVIMLPELFKNRLAYFLVFQHLRSVRRKPFFKQENDLYEYGYNYSLCCVISFVIAGFGVFQPVIFFSGLGFFALKFFGDFIALTCYFREQLYAKAVFLDMAVHRLKFCPSLPFAFLSVKCFLVKRQGLLWLNLGLLALTVLYGLARWARAFDIRLLFEPVNQLVFGRGVYQRPRIEDR